MTSIAFIMLLQSHSLPLLVLPENLKTALIMLHRSYFTKLLIEMHFLAARYWLEAEDEADVLSTTDILNLLNTMRVGAN